MQKNAFYILLLFNLSFFAKAMSLNEYLFHVSNNHPKILELEAKTGEFSADIQFADGAFDSRIDHNSFSWLTGYYDGIQATQRFTKPLTKYNAEVFTEYGTSTGDFPGYEEEFANLSGGGDISAGVKLSLLNGRETDKNRTAIASSRIKLKQWEEQIKLAQSDFYYSAILVYLNWLEAVSYYKKIEQLVEITKVRKISLEKRFKAGDIAKIALLEVETRLLERKSSLLSAEKTVRANEQKLSYFIQSQNKSGIADTSSVIKFEKIRWPFAFYTREEATVSSEHPALRAKSFEMDDLKQKMRLAKVELLPKLDIEAKVSRDLGTGSNVLHGTDSKVGLYFSMPLNRTQAKAKRSKVKFEIEGLLAETDALKQSINALLREKVINLKFAQQLNNMQQQQVTLSRKLFEQEQRQFSLGSSDFFMLNNREADAFSAELKALTTQVNVYREELAILKLEAQLDHNFIKKTVLYSKG